MGTFKLGFDMIGMRSLKALGLSCVFGVLSSFAVADGGNVLGSVPESGAFFAEHREDRGAVTVIDFSGNYDRDVLGQSNVEPRAVVAREFYRTHADNYDFLVVFTDFEFNTGFARAFHWSIQNQITGIGQEIFDNTEAFGSDGRLQGYTDMASMSRWVMDPYHPEFDTVLSVMGHELMHQWSGRARFDQGAGIDNGLLGRNNSHWSNLFDTGASVLYGHKWRNNGNGTFTSEANFKFFSPLDLYLAGFYGADEVPPMTLIENPEISPQFTPYQGLQNHGSTISGTARTVTIEDIIRAEGERVPSVENSQKDFRFAFILVTTPGKTVSDRAIANINYVRRAFLDRFSIWTGGRGVAHASSEELLELDEARPQVISGGDIRDNAMDLSEGFLWLRLARDEEGFWSDKETTTLRDSAVVLETLAQFDTSFPAANLNNSVAWLGDQTPNNLDFMARQAYLLQELGDSARASQLRSQILAQQNEDGGWGLDKGFESDPLDTALAIKALAGQYGVSDKVIAKAADYLWSQQNSDGGWPNRKSTPSRTSVTTEVITALRFAGRLDDTNSVISYFINKQNEDGGFGDSPSTTHDTANVIQTLIELEAMASVRIDDASAYLLNRQTVDGSWDGSVYTTSKVLSALQRFSFTNWVVKNVQTSAASVLDGDRIRIDFIVENNTAVSAPETIARVYDGDPAQGGMQIGQDIEVPALSAGRNVSLSAVWDTLDQVGDREIFVVVDPDAAQFETSESDNTEIQNITVEAAPEGIDLSLGESDVMVVPAMPITLPVDLGFAAFVRNVGLTDAENVRVQLRGGSVDGPILEEQNINIGNRATAAVNFTYNLTNAGSSTFFIVVDPANSIEESREDNNVVQRVVTTQSSMDPAIFAADISTDRTDAIIGEDITFSATLRNRGTVVTPSFDTRYFITDGETTTELLTTSNQIDAGQEYTQQVVWRADREGTVTFSVQIDPDNLLPELSEENNSASYELNSGQATGPNLAISYTDFTFDPNPGLEARELTLTALVRNTGSEDATNVEVAFYNGEPGAGGSLIESIQTIPSLAAGSSQEVNLTWSAVPDSAQKLLFVVLDPNNTVTEFLETDNEAFNLLDILSLADLAVSSADIGLEPEFPASGDTVSVNVRVGNLGQQAANGTVVRLYDQDPAMGGRLLGEQQTDIAGNEAQIVSFSYTVGSESGSSGQFYVQVDPENAILEQTTLNNNAARDYSIQDSDFAFDQRFISPNGDGLQDGANFYFRVNEPTNVSINIVDEWGLVVRSFNGSEYSNVSGGQLNWNGLDDFGRAVYDGLYRAQVVNEDNIILGEAVITVDTNRLPLLRAAGTPYASYTNYTCLVTSYTDFHESDDEEGGVYLQQNPEGYDSETETYALNSGVYSVDSSGGSLRAIVLESAIGPDASIYRMSAATDLSSIAMTVYNGNEGYQLWVADEGGSNLRSLENMDSNFSFIGYADNNEGVIAQYNNRLALFYMDGRPRLDLGSYSYEDEYQIVRTELSPDRNYLLIDGVNSYDEVRALLLYDLRDGSRRVLATEPTGDWYVYDESYWNPIWSPSSHNIAIYRTPVNDILIFDVVGNPINQIDLSTIGNGETPNTIRGFDWSDNERELTISMRFPGSFGQIDLGDGDNDGPVGVDLTAEEENVDYGGIYVIDPLRGSISQVWEYSAPSQGGYYEEASGVFDLFAPAAHAICEEESCDGEDGLPVINELMWMPNDRSLLVRTQDEYDYYNVNHFGLYLNRPEESNRDILFQEFSEPRQINDYRPSKTGRQLFFNSSVESSKQNSLCEGYNDQWSFRSLLNLSVDLRAFRSTRVGGVLLSGTASDAHLAQYTLEYAYADNLEDWRPIQPSSAQVVLDDEFTVWIPPTPGEYFVRLTVMDKAGNQRQKIKRVFWNETASITDLSRSPMLFSPNNDGVADVSTIQYRVLAPVHLEFNFFNEDEELVRTIVRDHSEVGETFQIGWDGRDASGQLLVDGRYRMAVQNYELYFEIDATSPVVEMELPDIYQSRDIYNSGGGYERTIVASGTSVSWEISDKNYKDSVVEVASASNLNSWQFFADSDPKTFGSERLKMTTDLDMVANKVYRTLAEDSAGNRTIINVGPVAEQLVLYSYASRDEGVQPVTWAEMEDLDGEEPRATIRDASAKVFFYVEESIAAGWQNMALQYRAIENSEDWVAGDEGWLNQTEELSFYANVDAETDVSVSEVNAGFIIKANLPESLQDRVLYAVRLRGEDSAGNIHYSNTFRLEVRESISFNGVLDASSYSVREMFSKYFEKEQIILSSNDYVLWGGLNLNRNADQVELFLQSNDDPRYSVEKSMGVRYDQESSYAYNTSELTSCVNYNIRVVAHINAYNDPVTGERIDGKIFTLNTAYRMSCLGLKVEVKPEIAESCGAPSPERLVVDFSPHAKDEVGLKLLTFSTEDEQDVIFNVNEPDNGWKGVSASGQEIYNFTHRYVIDTSDLAEGTYNYRARLVNNDDREVIRNVRVVVDKTPAQIAIGYPGNGDRVCGVLRDVQGSDQPFSVLTIEGLIQDENQFNYFMEFNSGTDYDEETSLKFHDLPAELNSFHDAENKTLPGKPNSLNNALYSEAGYSEVLNQSDLAGPLSELYNINGEYLIRTHAIDYGGFHQCVDQVVEFDGLVQVGRVTSDTLFSPNGDGRFDLALMDFTLEENADLTISIHNTAVVDGRLRALEESVGFVEQDLQVYVGNNQFGWDGTNGSGSDLPDNQYALVFTFTDACGNIERQTVFVEIDRTAPDVSVLFPTTDSPLPLIVEVVGTATDRNFSSYTVELGAGSSPDTWMPLSSSGIPTKDGQARVLASFNIFALLGDYTLRINAIDRVANETEYLVPLVITEPLDLISNLEAVESMFSPNGDGRRETTLIGFTFEQPVNATMTITGPQGQTLFENASYEVGPQTLAWNGRNENGDPLPSGNYRITLEAALATNELVTQTEEISLILDRTSPEITITQPARGFVTAGAIVAGTIRDQYLVDYRILLSDNPDQPSWNEVSTGDRDQIDAPLYVLPVEMEGDFVIRFEAQDEAENISILDIPFTVDSIPPRVELFTPEANSYLSGRELINISAALEEENPDSYELTYAPVGEPENRTVITSGTQFPWADVMTQWDVSDVPDGAYILRLYVNDLAGQEGVSEYVVNVDNTPPVAVITTPAENGWLAMGANILGSATDANFEAYSVEIAPGTLETANAFSPIISGGVGVSSSVLGRVDILPEDGLYVLRLRAEDKAGNVSEDLVAVEVDTTPPEAPTGLQAEVLEAADNLGDGSLTWNANTEDDLAGYRVYRDSALITPSLITDPEFLNTALQQGQYEYTVTAVDQAGNESEHSKPDSIVVDFQPPIVRISNPADESEVNEIVEIRGTAYSPDDFKEYRLYVAPVSAPDSRELLRQSPIPLQADILGEWNTIELVEGAQYIITLEGEDINGNIGTDDVTVTVDNRPPAQPTGLVAVADGSNVNLTWDANTEDDLLGYLVFRDEKIANATGTVIGSLEPYAVLDPEYTDLSLPDGPYTYNIVAIDDAGNTSDPSEPASVEIDVRVPQAIIVTPIDGTEFEQPIYVLATTEDNDVANVQFQISADGQVWTDLEQDLERPYEMTLDPAVYGIDYGQYQLRAVATDNSNQTDAAPQAVNITYRDLTAPEAVVNLSARVAGGDVNLSWTASGSDDLSGYYIERIGSTNQWERVNADPVVETEYVDTEMEDDQYRYRVFAVDLFDNESLSSEDVDAVVYTPVLQSILSPTASESENLVGQGVIQSNAQITVVNSAGENVLALVETDETGAFSTEFSLELESNEISVVLEDELGNTSKVATMSIDRGEAPSRPTGLAGSVDDTNVSLTWNPNPEDNILGYSLFRNGERVLTDESITGLTATASYNYYSPSRAIDTSNSTYWRPQSPYTNEWIALSWAETQLVSSLQVRWYRSYYSISNYDIQAQYNGEWVTILEVRDELRQTLHEHVLPRPYATTSVRLISRESRYFLVADLDVRSVSLIGDVFYDYVETDGVQEYTVSAINTAGFESLPSDPAELTVGDVVPPEAVVLTGEATNADVDLSWTESASDDVASYSLYRESGELLATVTDLQNRTYRDLGLLNGTYRYYVVATDARGNESEQSNIAEVEVFNTQAFELTVTAEAQGGVLSLSWVAPVEFAPANYELYRSVESGADFEQVAEFTGDVTDYIDSGLIADQTYYYVVRALNTDQTQSATSIEAFGTPFDLVAPEPPVIWGPTTAGNPITSEEEFIDVTGIAELGANIEMFVNGVNGVETVASELAETTGNVVSYMDDPQPSDDGRYVAGKRNNSLNLFDVETGETTTLLQTNAYGYPVRWGDEGELIFFIDYNNGYYARAYDLTFEEVYDITDPSTGNIYFAAPSPVGQELVLTGYYDDGSGQRQGLWLNRFGQMTLIREDSYYRFENRSIQWSQDGQRLAYINTSGNPDTLEIYNTADQSLTVADISVNPRNPSWSPDGTQIVFEAYENGTNNLYSYAIDTGETTRIFADENISVSTPKFSPDGQSVMFENYRDSNLYMLNLEAGQLSLAFDGNNIDLRSWLPSGKLFAYVNYDGYYVMNPPGYFNARGVRLNVGDNTIAAIATDASNNESLGSEAISVSFTLNGRADLQIDESSIIVLPATPKTNEETRLAVKVSNVGNSASTPTDISLVVVDPQGETQSLLSNVTVGAIDVGGSSTFNTNWTVGTLEGEYSLIATVDAYNYVEEVSESNNTGIKRLTVIGEGSVGSSIATDREGYQADQNVIVTTSILNSVDQFEGRYTVAITDTAGYDVVQLADETLGPLAYAEQVNNEYLWNTGDIYAGRYLAIINVFDELDEVVSTQITMFEVGSSNTVEASVATDRASYPGNSDVRVTGTIDIVSGNAVFSNAVATLQILAEDLTIMAESSYVLADMLVGNTTSVKLDWNTGLEALGTYSVQLTVMQNAEEVASVTNTFNIESSGIAVSGTLNLDNTRPDLGADVTATYSINNLGNAEVTDLPVTLSVIDTQTLSVLISEEVSLSIPVAESVPAEWTFSTNDLTLRDYTVRLQANVEGETQQLASASFVPVDLDMPNIAILTPEAESWSASNDVSALFYARDGLSPIEMVEYQLDSGEWLTAEVYSVAEGQYRARLTGLAEGAHVLQARATDAVGNVSVTTPLTFMVDTIAPQITIAGIENSAIVNRVFGADITIVEENLADSTNSLNSETYVSGELITEDGEYILSVEASDLAGNTSSEIVTFTIDTIAPVIEVSGVDNGQITNQNLVPVVSIIEERLASSLTELNGEVFISGTAVTEENAYVLEITAEDTAGNTSDLIVEFELDLTPPTLTIVSPQNGETTEASAIAITGVSEAGATVNMTAVSGNATQFVDTNGEFTFLNVGLFSGDNNFGFVAQDAAGNTSDQVELLVTRINTSGEAQMDGRLIPGQRVLVYMSQTDQDNVLDDLQMILDLKGVSSFVVDNEHDLITQIRTREFTSVMLVDLCDAKVNPADCMNFSFSTNLELKSTGHAGMGLTVIKTDRKYSSSLLSFFHLEALGGMFAEMDLILEESDATAANIHEYVGNVTVINGSEGQSVGWLNDHPVMNISTQGNGNVVVMGFNPFGIADIQAHEDLFDKVITYVTPSTMPLFANSAFELQWNAMDLTGTPVDLQLDGLLPAGFSFLAMESGEILSERSGQWQLTAEESSQLFRSTIRLANQEGNSALSATLYDVRGGGAVELAVSELEVQVEADTLVREIDILNTLSELPVTGADADLRDNAISAIYKLRFKSKEKLDDMDDAVGSITNAFKSVGSIDCEHIDPLKIKVSELLLMYQGYWHQANN